MSSRSSIYLPALLVILPGIANAQVFDLQQVNVTGATDEKINIVFLSEGYTQDEIQKFHSDVGRATQDLFQTPPYQQYRSYFNVFALDVLSNESGSDHPGTASDEPPGTLVFERDTFFESTYDFSGIHRLLVPERTKVYLTLLENFPEWDIAFVIVNHEMYGGSGGLSATFSLNQASSEIAIHELGHSFSHLGDEYETGSGTGFEAPNVTSETRREMIKWRIWIKDETPVPTPEIPFYEDDVGLFEGAAITRTGWYRPKLDCKMRSLGVRYCEVCTEQTILSIYNLLDTFESYEPVASTILMLGNSVRDFVIRPRLPTPNTISICWFLDDLKLDTTGSTLTFDASEFEGEEYILRAVVADTNRLVRNHPDSLTFSQIEWLLQIERSATGIDEPDIPAAFQLFPNFPNPFNPGTTIRYELPRQADVVVAVYALNGQEVVRLQDGHLQAGVQQVSWDGRNARGEPVSSGVYVYRVKAGTVVKSGKMLLLR